MLTMCAAEFSLTPTTLAISSNDAKVDGGNILTNINTDPIAHGGGTYFEATSTNGQFFPAGRTTMIYENVYADVYPNKQPENPQGGYTLETGVYACPISGRYLVNAVIGFDVTDMEFLLNAFIYVNGVEKLQTFFPYAAISNLQLHSGVFQGVVSCNQGDRIEIKVYVSDGPSNVDGTYGQFSYGVESINRLTIYRLPY